MLNRPGLIFGFVLLLLTLGCADSEKSDAPTTEVPAGAPDWFVNLPEDDTHLYAARTATSLDLQLAINKAVAAARADLARRVDPQASEVTLTGSRVIRQEYVQEEERWRAYVLVQYPVTTAARKGAE